MISVNWYCKGVSVDKDIKSRSVKTDKDSGLPMQGVYESIRVTGDYKPRLDQIAAGGFKVVLNYSIPGSVSANMAQLLAYADYANSKGLKVIWAMKNHQWWDGTYSADSVTILVNVLKNHTATWGYYVTDDDVGMVASKIISHSKNIRAADPNPAHPLLTAENKSMFKNGTMQALEPANDCIGYWRYAIGEHATMEELYAAEDIWFNKIFDWVKTTNKPFILGMQANDVRACYPRLAKNFPYSHWPTAKEMTDLRNHILAIAKAKGVLVPLILWYSYYDIIRVNPSAWDTLVKAAFAPLP